MDFSGFEGGGGRGPERRSGAASYVDPESTIDGTIRTDHDLRVEGSVSGRIQCDGVLLVAEGALVDAEIDAASIVVAGEMSGTVRCRGRLEIQATGIVRGDVRTGALVIHEGARYEGQIAMEASAERVEETELVEADEALAEEAEAGQEGGYSFLRRFAPEDDELEAERENDE